MGSTADVVELNTGAGDAVDVFSTDAVVVFSPGVGDTVVVFSTGAGGAGVVTFVVFGAGGAGEVESDPHPDKVMAANTDATAKPNDLIADGKQKKCKWLND